MINFQMTVCYLSRSNISNISGTV